MSHITKPMQVKFHLLLILICCLGSSACLSDINLDAIGLSSRPPASDPLVDDARDAWENGNMQMAENLYARAVKLSLPQDELTESWERYALAAARNGRPNSALDALEQWDAIMPDADSTNAWQNAWLSSARLLSPSLTVQRAEKTWAKTSNSANARAQAAIILMGRTWTSAKSNTAIPLINSYYNSKDINQKQHIEAITSEEMRYMTEGNLSSLASTVSAKSQFAYPTNIILLEAARRKISLSASTLAKLKDLSLYADPSLPQRILNLPATSTQPVPAPTTPTISTAPVADMQGACVVLALPSSGSIASISQKIRAGADVAKAELVKQGMQVHVQNIDTTQVDWISKLNALPPQCAVVGGPLQTANFNAAKSAGVTNNRNFFTFLPTLEGQDEGNIAWRFFPSPEDQISSLLSFTQGLGINSYASFYPQDNYGIRMNTIFNEAVNGMGGQLQSIGYNPNDSSSWIGSAQTLLAPTRINNTPISNATFEAVFLPDSWKNMDLITNAFRYNGDEKQVLLGTSLWEQSLMSGQGTTQLSNYKLAVFPAAWNNAQVPQALSSLGHADFWTGLGYDFVRFGLSLNLSAPSQAAELNTKLQTTQIAWSMAPISYGLNGKASQKLFLFTLSSEGPKQVEAASFNQLRQQIIESFNARRNAVGGAAIPATVPATAPVAQPPVSQ